MSSTQSSPLASVDPAVDQIISFWFHDPKFPEPARKWYGGGEAVDEEIRSRFSDLVVSARSQALDSWTQSPNGTLALLILLDQFPRNLYRGKADAFASDGLAVKTATLGIAQGQDRQLPYSYQKFFYMPFMHDESLLGQVAGVSLFEGWAARGATESSSEKEREMATNSLGYAIRHRDCIVKYGRFPARNAALGRESTPEEVGLLKTNPAGF